MECDHFVSADAMINLNVDDGMNEAGFFDFSNVSSNQMRCRTFYDQCVALWRFNETTNETSVVLKGCWRGSAECNNRQCIAHDNLNSRIISNARFCCCSNPMCNTNYSFVYSPRNKGIMKKGTLPSLFDEHLLITASCCLILILFMACLIRTLYNRHCKGLLDKKMSSSSVSHACDSDLHYANCQYRQGHFMLLYDDLSDLIFGKRIAKSNCSDVYLAYSIREKMELAVKIYRSKKKNYQDSASVQCSESSSKISSSFHHVFENECSINELLQPFNHQNILPFVAWFKHDEQENLEDHNVSNECIQLIKGLGELWIITQYSPLGSLRAFLTLNVIGIPMLLDLSCSLANGLKFLHEELYENDVLLKPSIAHRDLNSCNIFVKPNGVCMVGDFGHSMNLNVLKESLAHSKQDLRIAEVGTTRYMAPELLDGLVHVSEFSNCLKQADIYALALILWEIFTCCSDMSNENIKYKLPYARELHDIKPTTKEMKTLVCQRRIRPSFPRNLNKLNEDVFSRYKTLIEDCWLHDPDARISALLVCIRLESLQSAFKSERRSLSGGGCAKAPVNFRIDMKSSCRKNRLISTCSERQRPATSPDHAAAIDLSKDNTVSVKHRAASACYSLPSSFVILSDQRSPARQHVNKDHSIVQRSTIMTHQLDLYSATTTNRSVTTSGVASLWWTSSHSQGTATKSNSSPNYASADVIVHRLLPSPDVVEPSHFAGIMSNVNNKNILPTPGSCLDLDHQTTDLKSDGSLGPVSF